ncbi:Ankyrin-1 [Paramyrothecium foliicola]|nr:Ankyrin-1 [Paramyrothecium foliicola]
MSNKTFLVDLPYEIQLEICHHADFKTLASLARICHTIRPVAEEHLYRKDVQHPRGAAASFWAATHGFLGTLDKAFAYNKHLPDGGLQALTGVAQATRWETIPSWPQWIFHSGRQSMTLKSLHLAVAAGHDALVLRLLDAGADKDEVAECHQCELLGCSFKYVTPLYIALIYERLSTACILLNQGANQTVASTQNGAPVFSALHVAALTGSSQMVERLLSTYNANLNNDSNINHILPVHMALLRADGVRCLKRLLEAGARIDTILRLQSKGGDELTALQLLTFLDEDAALRTAIDLLMNAGADIHGRDENGHTLLHFASSKAKAYMIQCLLEKGLDPNEGLDSFETPNDTPLHMVASNLQSPDSGMKVSKALVRHLECVKILVKAGAVVHFDTIFHFLKSHAPEIADFLYPFMVDPPKEADIWIQNFWNVAGTLRMGSNLLAFLFKRCPPDIGNAVAPDWKRLIYRLFGYPEINLGYVISFLKRNIAIAQSLTNQEGCDVLMRLVRNNNFSHQKHANLLQRLISFGFNSKTMDHHGNTYIHHLCSNEQVPGPDFVATLQLFIGMGVDINAKNMQGFTALHHLARYWGKRARDRKMGWFSPDLNTRHHYKRALHKLDVLLKNNANKYIRNNSGAIPLDLLLATEPEEDAIDNLCYCLDDCEIPTNAVARQVDGVRRCNDETIPEKLVNCEATLLETDDVIGSEVAGMLDLESPPVSPIFIDEYEGFPMPSFTRSDFGSPNHDYYDAEETCIGFNDMFAIAKGLLTIGQS